MIFKTIVVYGTSAVVMYPGVQHNLHVSNQVVSCALLQTLMNVLKVTTAAVQMHIALTPLEDFSVPVYMATVEMDLIAVRFAICTVWFESITHYHRVVMI